MNRGFSGTADGLEQAKGWEEHGGLQVSPIETTYGARGFPTYTCKVTHVGLTRNRLIRGPDPEYVRTKAQLQAAEWLELWHKKVGKLSALQWIFDKKAEAKHLTEGAVAKVAAIESILTEKKTPNVEEAWGSILGDTVFRVPEPEVRLAPSAPQMPEEPGEPIASAAPYRASVLWFDYLLPGRPRKLRDQAAELLAEAKKEWRREHKEWSVKFARQVEAHKQLIEQINRENAEDKAKWRAQKQDFDAAVRRRTEEIAALRASFERHEVDAVRSYMDAILALSEYPESFLQEWDLDYVELAKTLIVDYQLPTPGFMPKVKEVRYVSSRNELVESLLSDGQVNKLYDLALYQTALRVAWEVFTADNAQAIDAVCINGFVKDVSPATGHEVEACILSLQVRRDEFLQVNLDAVDPKECFKRFKGIASGKLSGLVAVAPIQKIDRQDKRFINGHGVLGGVDEGLNLAAMDWQEFEHLIRELFEREFCADGSEVRITQASRDGGVDAVVFDSDPIRGGKIVIQAKRYTGLVDVSAVRDLFGTVHNEGALKGILVTTSNYGPDAYEFAKGKPLTLLNGGNLMHLLQKHGTRAHIDLKAAKAQLKSASQQQAPGSR